MSLYNYTIDYEIVQSFGKELCCQYNIIPLYYGELFLTVARSSSSISEEELSRILKSPVKVIDVAYEELQFEWRYYSIKTSLYNLSKKISLRLNKKEDSKEIISFIENLLHFAIENNTSDIHIEALHESVVIRLRIDGVLQQFFRYEIELFSILSSYIKYLANLDIAQKRIPLNSRFSKYILDKTYDIRVSTLPTIYGESLVLRILNNQNTQKKLKDLGFSKNSLTTLRKILNLKQGLFLVTGPTGSGKTTTLYSMISEIYSLEKKIITVEDPVEYKIEGVMQVNINEDMNLNYQQVLKNILRQDPDILLIGEIRDKESLKIAIQASLTGHLVLATLHTNSALESIYRLFDLEAEPYLVRATLKGVLSQRLVRTLCSECKEKEESIYKKVGCKACNYTGYSGRQIVSEILAIDETSKILISKEQSIEKLQKYLENTKFITIDEECKNLINRGITTYEEYLNKI